MLQSPAAYRQMWSGLVSDPGYGDLCAKIIRKWSVLSVCALSPKKTNTRSRTRGNNVQKLPFGTYCTTVKKEKVKAAVIREAKI